MTTSYRLGNDAPVLNKSNAMLSAIASLLIFAGLLGLFAPELLEALLPADIAEDVFQTAVLLLIAGAGLEGYLIYRFVQRIKTQVAQAKRAAAMQGVVPGVGAPADSLAQRIDWSPAENGGANFRTKRMHERGPSRIEVRATGQMTLFCALFIVIGIGIGSAAAFTGRHDPLSLRTLVTILFGLFFAVVGAAILYWSRRPAVFDRQLGWYWRGSPKLRTPGEIRRQRQATELANVQALQLLTEHVSGKSSYNSYELNLVLKDGKRINVMDHGDEAALSADAELLALFLGVPVWKQPVG